MLTMTARHSSMTSAHDCEFESFCINRRAIPNLFVSPINRLTSITSTTIQSFKRTFTQSSRLFKMTDAGRKNVSDKVAETMKPDSQKSYAEQIKEQATGTYDKLARDMQPKESKGTFQSVADTMSTNKDEAKSSADASKQSYLDSAKEYAASAQKVATEKLNQASEYLSKKSDE
ncbi:heat shock protein 9/12-domain-containing protein [Limtongia smithiae]|uniref:heat shock protein 9/12-domain-containing protein n=1 Tax=Limtongia smithiae TaxID=1125753 RepID=UPI0034CE98F3